MTPRNWILDIADRIFLATQKTLENSGRIPGAGSIRSNLIQSFWTQLEGPESNLSLARETYEKLCSNPEGIETHLAKMSVLLRRKEMLRGQ